MQNKTCSLISIKSKTINLHNIKMYLHEPTPHPQRRPTLWSRSIYPQESSESPCKHYTLLPLPLQNQYSIINSFFSYKWKSYPSQSKWYIKSMGSSASNQDSIALKQLSKILPNKVEKVQKGYMKQTDKQPTLKRNKKPYMSSTSCIKPKALESKTFPVSSPPTL